MSLADVEKAIDLINGHEDDADFDGRKTDGQIREAEIFLGLEFPDTYRLFLRECGCGDIAGEEFFGLVGSTVPGPASVPNMVWLTKNERADSGLPPSMILVGASGDGSYYAIDIAANSTIVEPPVVLWTPGVEETEMRARDFGRFFFEAVEGALS